MGNKNSTGDMLELTENEIELLLANTNMDKYQILEWFDDFKQDFPSGKLNKKNFREVYNSMFPQALSNKFSDYVFAVFDEDDSGFIEFNEFLLAVSINSDKDISKRLHLAFKIYDINNNGSVDSKEMTKILKALYDLKGIPKEERKGENSIDVLVKNIFEKFDKDENKNLSVDEFVNGFMAHENLIKLILPIK